MEITKQNQTFKINDTTSEGWTITGSATQDVEGYTTISFNINKDGELKNQVGYYNYSIPKNGMANVNITSNPESLDAFIDYAQTATQKIKDYLANQTISSNMGRKKCNSPRAGLAKGGKCGGGKKTK